jgi:hypothetical protein
MCSVAIDVLEPGAFNAESEYFIPLFNRISWLCEQNPNRGWSIKWGAQLMPNRFVFQLDAMWEPGRISLDGCQWEWELRSGYHMSFSLVLHRFSSNRWEPPNTGYNHWFQFFDYFRIRELSGFDETLQNFIYKHTVNLENVQMNKKKEKGEFTRCQVSSN